MSIPSSQYQGILPPIPDRIIPGNRSTITTISMRYRWIRLQRWHQTRQERNTVIWRQLWMWEFRQEATKHTRRWKLKTEWRRSEWIQLQKSKQVHSLKVNINQHTVKDSSQLLRQTYAKLSGAYPRADTSPSETSGYGSTPGTFFGFHPFPKLARISKYPSLDVSVHSIYLSSYDIFGVINIYIYHLIS